MCFDVAIRLLPEEPFLAQFVIVEAALVVILIRRFNPFLPVNRVHLDANRGKLLSFISRTRFSDPVITHFDLSHVGFLHVAERFTNKWFQSSTSQIVERTFMLEVVSMYEPILIACGRDPSGVTEVVTQMDDFRENWQRRPEVNVPLPFNSCRRPAVVLRAQSEGKARRLSLMPSTAAALRLFVISAALLHSGVVNMEPSYLSFALDKAHSVAIALGFSAKVDGRDHPMDGGSFAAPGAVSPTRGVAHTARRRGAASNRRGVLRRLDVARCVARDGVTMDVAAAQRPGSFESEGVNKLGGRRFGLSWRDGEGRQVLQIGRLLGAEAAYLAEKIRAARPQLFEEEDGDAL
ncbi:hypothetical protein FGB62_97g17 [Gracilaria domingensis]|nr:hypothetical protein FGB62_97g17 [Gracilaria domingensis]